LPKDIVICADGTGNTVVRGRGTNVFKLFEAVDINGHRKISGRTPQVGFYTDGVGTEGNQYARLLGSLFGFGLKRNVLHLYRDLAHSYEPGDKIFMFGFSRGAFTVRMLAGLIDVCGVLRVEETEGDSALLKRYSNLAYDAYLAIQPTTLEGRIKWGRSTKAAWLRFAELRDKVSQHPTPIEFIGVWDTVGALGFPIEKVATFWNRHIRRFQFARTDVKENVTCARHALSIDDARASFHPMLWNNTGHADTKQVWFAGVHANVGGGYPKQGMSLVSLDWMMAEAEARGLVFIDSLRDQYRDAQNVHDHIYDSRAGLRTYYRFKFRDLDKICKQADVPLRIHESVGERIFMGTELYAPGNVPSDFEIEPYRPGDLVGWWVARLQHITHKTGDGEDLLDDVSVWRFLKKGCYWGMLVATMLIAVELGADAWAASAGPARTGLDQLLLAVQDTTGTLSMFERGNREASELTGQGLAYSLSAPGIAGVVYRVVEAALLLVGVAMTFYLISILARERIYGHFREKWFQRVLAARNLRLPPDYPRSAEALAARAARDPAP
jgi:uncharacterized protein (DUF2235 family)